MGTHALAKWNGRYWKNNNKRQITAAKCIILCRGNGVVTCEIKLLQYYFSLHRHTSEIIFFSVWKLAWNYFTGYCSLWIYSNMFVVAEIILKYMRIYIYIYMRNWLTCSQIKWKHCNSFGGWHNFISVSDIVTCEIKHWNNFKIISK